MFNESIAALLAFKNRGSMDCRYVLSYDTDPIEYFNDNTELEYFLAIHEIEHYTEWEETEDYGPVPYYAFSDNNYHIVDLEEEKECRIYQNVW